MTPVSIRLATDDEIEEIIALDRATLPECLPSADTDWWGAWDGHDLVGYAGGRLIGTGAYYLSRAGVLLAYRGQGIQKRLIRCRVARARRLGAPRAVTYTSPLNAASMNNLIACGFKTTKPWAGDDEDWVYWRRNL